jgi:pyruvate dehydrogenase E2 component (dihydrolipoamide acetyltransferase)
VLAVLRDEAATRPGPATAEPVPARKDETAARRVRASPSARRLARELGVDIDRIAGSAPERAVSREDVERASQRPDEESAGARMRRAVARAVALSKRDIPHYYLLHAIDMAPALAWLEGLNSRRAVDARILPSALLLKAVARSVREFPELNGRWEAGGFVPSTRVHAGMAISLRGGGLVAPAVHDADQLALGEVMECLKDLSERARSGALRSSEMTDGTITVTSLGERGVEVLIGVIHPPQVALVGFGRILGRPWVFDGRVVPRPVVQASLSADHRVSDGHRGALFLSRLEKYLLEPATLESESGSDHDR